MILNGYKAKPDLEIETDLLHVLINDSLVMIYATYVTFSVILLETV